MVSALSLSSALLLAAPLTRASRCTGYTLGGSTTSRSPPTPASTISVCTVTPLGWGRDDAPQIMAAAEACGEDGVIELPAPYVYTISSRLYMKLVRATLNVFGTLSFTPDLGYWIDNSHRIEFQNQSTAWIVEGEDYVITGGGWQQGGILGNGQAWYGRAAGQSNQFGRPICLSLVNSTNATVKDFTVRQGQFWTFYLQDSYDIKLTGIYINGTNTDPAAGAAGLNYEVNVDGLDSIRVNGLTTADWVFHGGDDCLAPKGNSTNMVFRNMTCVGGGIAFGSIGQYATAPDYIANNISPKYGGAGVSGGAYFKSWVGVAEGSPPQGGGGGTGRVWNITFDNLRVENTTKAVYVNKCYYKVADQANYCDTSTLQFSELSFHEVSGYVSSPYGVSFNCSGAAHCDDITITDLDLTYSGAEAGIYCDNKSVTDSVYRYGNESQTGYGLGKR
ncbi:pectin lyase-like protein [Thozetella sp. PMI_491]|nr:pectin lyase-like protein [Thozetella sp. PMI_491]